MHIGMVGLGKMGLNMAYRLIQGGHQVTGFDLSDDNIRELTGGGGTGGTSLEDLVQKLDAPRAVWVMVPAGRATESVIQNVAALLEEGDTIIDGGNTRYIDTVRRSKALAEQNLFLVDVGTSGGIWGLKEGYSMMVGGEKEPVERLFPIFETLAPAKDKGWGHVGPSGAGHFTKMVHNGIEYGLMQAYAEGFHILEAKREFGLDLHQVAEIWRTGSVVRSWLLDLCSLALEHNADLSGIAPFVQDSGEGRWTVFESIDLDVPAPVITLALMERLRSRLDNSFTDRMLAALRNQFGGHAVMKVEAKDTLPDSPLEGGDVPPPQDVTPPEHG